VKPCSFSNKDIAYLSKMAAKQYKWYKVAESRAALGLGANGMTIVEAGGKKVTLALHGDRLWGCAHKCPHASGVMAEGFIDAPGNVVCPLHRYRFSLQNGRNVSGEGYYLKTYAVEERGDGIYVGMEEGGGLFGWLK
jgi:nitrite reductase/ring-hydroxylating ferredoxin subunit